MKAKRWPLRPLIRCAKFLSGGTPSKARADFWEGDIPWVSSGEMAQMRIHDTPLHITAEGAEDGSRLVPENTVLAVVRGMSLAKEFRVALTQREVAFNQDLKAFACVPDVEPEFLFYALFARREHIRDLATEASHGTKKLETDTLGAVELNVPEPELQRRVIPVARNYDDLIDNNQRRMTLLEEAARLLYREWFVHLRFPGHECSLINDGVPSGWEKKKVQELLAFTIGGGWGGDEQNSKFSEPASVVRGTDIPDIKRGDFSAVPNRFHAESNLASRRLVGGDIILEVSNGNIRNIGRTLRLESSVLDVFGGDAMCASFCRLLRTVAERESHLLASHFEEIQASGRMDFFKTPSAAGINNFRFTGLLEEEDVLVPSQEIYDQFITQVASLRAQAANLIVMNQKLRTARDLLLPRLMSGEVAV